MHPMTDAQVLIREAHDKAERLCALAVEQTPAEYQSFITLIEQRRKVGGSRQAPIFATVRQPYLSVDGRVKWARDEHRRAGQRFDVQVEFVVEPTSGQLLARATLTSELYGTVVAHARVFLGGDGVNESNPLETGETSAVGRALGMWGFGCYGTGIASACGSPTDRSRHPRPRRRGPTTAGPGPPRTPRLRRTREIRPESPNWRNSARRSGCARARWRCGAPRQPPTRRRLPPSAGSWPLTSRAAS
jgi:hypothetical protein